MSTFRLTEEQIARLALGTWTEGDVPGPADSVILEPVFENPDGEIVPVFDRRGPVKFDVPIGFVGEIRADGTADLIVTGAALFGHGARVSVLLTQSEADEPVRVDAR